MGSVPDPNVATMFVVDEDKMIRDTLRHLLEDQGYTVECFATGIAFLDRSTEEQRGCALIDASMAATNGIDVLQKLRARAIDMPAIMMSGQPELGMVVEAMKSGAVDFLAKPFSCSILLATIREALKEATVSFEQSSLRRIAEQRVAKLTSRQREILDLVVAGHSSKSIAACLSISQRTVDNHRAAIALKTCSKSLVQLIKTATCAGCGADATHRAREKQVPTNIYAGLASSRQNPEPGTFGLMNRGGI